MVPAHRDLAKIDTHTHRERENIQYTIHIERKDIYKYNLFFNSDIK